MSTLSPSSSACRSYCNICIQFWQPRQDHSRRCFPIASDRPQVCVSLLVPGESPIRDETGARQGDRRRHLNHTPRSEGHLGIFLSGGKAPTSCSTTTMTQSPTTPRLSASASRTPPVTAPEHGSTPKNAITTTQSPTTPARSNSTPKIPTPISGTSLGPTRRKAKQTETVVSTSLPTTPATPHLPTA